MAPDIPLSFADAASTANASSDTSPRLIIHGSAEIAFERRDGATRLVRLFHHDPLRVLFPNPRTGDVALATLVTTSGGLVGGDRLDIAASVGAGASAMITTQAAEKVYRSNGPDVVVSTDLKAGDGAWMEWLPQEAILFDGARLRRTTSLDVAGGGRAMAGELLVFGRTAHGGDLPMGWRGMPGRSGATGGSPGRTRCIWTGISLQSSITPPASRSGRLWHHPVRSSRRGPSSG